MPIHSNEPSTSKIDDYIRNESQAQFSAAKRAAIEANPVGKSKLGQNLTEELRENLMHKMARLKNGSVSSCELCGASLVIDDIRKKVILCPRCEESRSVVERMLGNRHSQHLNDTDRKSILSSRTLRVGPFYNPKKI